MVQLVRRQANRRQETKSQKPSTDIKSMQRHTNTSSISITNYTSLLYEPCVHSEWIYQAAFPPKKMILFCSKSLSFLRRGVSANSPQRFVLYKIAKKRRDLTQVLFQVLPHPPYHSTPHTSHNPARSPLVRCPQALTRDIPHSHGLVQTGWHHQILRWMELGAHHIVIMASQHTVDEKRGEGILMIDKDLTDSSVSLSVAEVLWRLQLPDILVNRSSLTCRCCCICTIIYPKYGQAMINKK